MKIENRALRPLVGRFRVLEGRRRALLVVAVASAALLVLVTLHDSTTTVASPQASEIATMRAALARIPSAVQHVQAGRYAEGEAHFLGILEDLPKPEHALAAAAMLELPNARTYRRLIASLHTNAALCRIRSRRPEQALELLDSAIRLAPQVATAWKNRGVARLELRDYEGALADLGHAFRLGATGHRHRVKLGEAALGAGHPDRSERWFASVRRPDRLAVDAWGSWLESRRGLASALRSQGRLADARQVLEEALEAAPGDVESRYALIQILARLGESELSERERRRYDADSSKLADIQAMLSANPGQVKTLHQIATLYLDLGLRHLAAVHYRQLLVRNPNDPIARRELASLIGWSQQ